MGSLYISASGNRPIEMVNLSASANPSRHLLPILRVSVGFGSPRGSRGQRPAGLTAEPHAFRPLTHGLFPHCSFTPGTWIVRI
jgi:hypothetical protein